MTRYLLTGSLLLALSAGAYGWWQDKRATAAVARAVAAEAQVAAYAEAARVHAAHVARLQALLADATATDFDLQSMEGANAPLSPYLGTAAGRLWN